MVQMVAGTGTAPCSSGLLECAELTREFLAACIQVQRLFCDLIGNFNTRCPSGLKAFFRVVQLAAVLERRRMQHLITTTLPSTAVPGLHPQAPGTPLRHGLQHPGGAVPASPPFTDAFVLPKPLVSVDDFQSVLGLAQTLARSKNAQVFI